MNLVFSSFFQKGGVTPEKSSTTKDTPKSGTKKDYATTLVEGDNFVFYGADFQQSSPSLLPKITVCRFSPLIKLI